MSEFARNRCSRSLGIGVHVRSESVFTFARNRCSRSLGIGVHVRSESVFTFNRNMHQFTSEAFTGVLKRNGIRISIDGKRSWMDNVFIERLWRSLKYEEVYLKAYDSVRSAVEGIGGWIDFYNTCRRHQGLDRSTPDQVYYGLPRGLPKVA